MNQMYDPGAPPAGIVIRKAERRRVKLRAALIGPANSGKSYSALLLAFGLGGKIGVIDTEKSSAHLYADLGAYDIIELDPPFTVARYIAAIRAFEDADYNVIILDSLTHAWSGQGGLLEKKDRISQGADAKNSYTAWGKITPEHNALIDTLLGSSSHIIATMRTKTEYVLEPNDKGKLVPHKIGLAPIQRDGMEYEFTLVMDIDASHKVTVSKDRTGLFEDWYDKVTPETGQKIMAWLDRGAAAPIVKPPEEPMSRVMPNQNIRQATTVYHAVGIAAEYYERAIGALYDATDQLVFIEMLDTTVRGAPNREAVDMFKKLESVQNALKFAPIPIRKRIDAMFFSKYQSLAEEAISYADINRDDEARSG